MGCSNEILLSGLLLQNDDDYVYEKMEQPCKKERNDFTF